MSQSRQRPMRQAPRERSFGLMSALFYCAIALVMIVVAAGTFLLVAAPVDLLRDQVAAQVKARTGRDLTITGRSSVMFYPSLGVSFSDVKLSPPPGMSGPAAVEMAGLDVAVAIWPLLSRKIDVQRLVLRRPVFNLYVDAQGRRSWDFASLTPPTAIRVAQAGGGQGTLPKELQDFVQGSSNQPRAADVEAILSTLAALELYVEEGTVDYADARAAVRERVTGLDLRLSFRGATQPLTATGKMTLRNEPLDFEARVLSPDRLIVSQPSKADVRVSGRQLALRFDGTVNPQPVLLDGTLTLDAPSGKTLAGLLRKPALAGDGVPALKFSGLVKANETTVAVNNAKIGLGDAEATGTVFADFAGARPLVRTNMRVSEIDIDRLGSLATALAAPSQRADTPAAGGGQQPPRGIGDLIERTAPAPGTQVRGFRQRGDWSDAPLDFSGLATIDADAKFAIGRVVSTHVKLGPTQTTVALKGGALRVTFDDVQLYEGRARGILTLDGSGRVPTFGLNMNADGIAMKPFLADVADNDRLSGRGRLVLALAGSGATERQMMMSLEGKGDATVTNGSIAGFDGARQILAILQGQQNQQQGGGTTFSEASGSVVVTGGVARNSDFKLNGSGLRITGAGDIDIGHRQIDFLLKPRAETMAVEVPIRVRGPWDDTRVVAEVNPEKAMEAIRDLGRQFRGQNAGEILRGLVEPGENGEPPKARQLLEQFLRR